MYVLCEADKAMIWTKIKFATQLLVQNVILWTLDTMWLGTNILEKTITSNFSEDIYAYVYMYVS